jgi:hypothetical protein
VIYFFKTNIMRHGNFWDCKEGKLLGGVELARNSWLSATSWRSDLYFFKENFSKQKATCNFSFNALASYRGHNFG